MKGISFVRGALIGVTLAVTAGVRAISLSPTLLPVSDGILTLGEWNSNFSGALSAANEYNVPLLVFFGGLSCGKCEMLQQACMTEEFLAWQREHKMLMVFTMNNSRGDASGFSKPVESSGFPFIAVYWNRYGMAPRKDTELYRTFCGRDGEMLVTGGTLTDQLIGSIESVVGAYDFSHRPDISERAEVVYSEPVTTKTRYEVQLFTGFDASSALTPQRVYNLSESTKPKFRKVSGALPTGIKLKYADGAVVLSGKTMKTGTFRYKFAIQQRRSGVLHEGPAIELAFTVTAANDAARGGCAMLGRGVNSTVPLFFEEASDKAMKGVVELTTTARNRIKAKYMGISGSKGSFIGEWTEIEGGKAKASLRARGMVLALEMGGDGALNAVLSDPNVPAPLVSFEDMKVGSGSFAESFAGAFAVSLVEKPGQTDAGCGYVCINKITAAGKVQWSGVLGDGQTISGSSFAMRDSIGRGVVVVFKRTPKNYVALALAIRPNLPKTGEQRAVIAYEGTVPQWGRHALPKSAHDCTVYGSRISKEFVLEECCMAQFADTKLTLSAETDGFTSKGLGAVTSAPVVDVVVKANKLVLAARSSTVKMSFLQASGVFRGTMMVTFANGNKRVKFAGVVIPGWHDCGCEPIDVSDPFHIDVSQPFALGTAWFNDGGSPRGFTVKIDERAY